MTIEVEKTHFLTVDDKTVPVSNLPEQVREQVKIFDEIRQDVMDKSYELNVYQMAAEYKKQQLERLMQQYLEAQQKKESEDAEAETLDQAPKSATNQSKSDSSPE